MIKNTKSQIKEYVMLMMGAPVKHVPITEERLTMCVDQSFTSFESYTGETLTEDFEITQEVMRLLQMAALANAKMCMGKDNKPLMREGKREWQKAQNAYLEYIPTFMKEEPMDNEEPITPSTPYNPNIKGLMVFYINVGMLPPFKAEAFVERIKAKTDLDQTKKVCEVIYIPTRDRPTQVEYIPFGV